jgi:hypothetical protein
MEVIMVFSDDEMAYIAGRIVAMGRRLIQLLPNSLTVDDLVELYIHPEDRDVMRRASQLVGIYRSMQSVLTVHGSGGARINAQASSSMLFPAYVTNSRPILDTPAGEKLCDWSQLAMAIAAECAEGIAALTYLNVELAAPEQFPMFLSDMLALARIEDGCACPFDRPSMREYKKKLEQMTKRKAKSVPAIPRAVTQACRELSGLVARHSLVENADPARCEVTLHLQDATKVALPAFALVKGCRWGDVADRQLISSMRTELYDAKLKANTLGDAW